MPHRFVGLGYEKSKLSQPLFTAGNANLISLFKLLGNGVLRIGGNSVDYQCARRISPRHRLACPLGLSVAADSFSGYIPSGSAALILITLG